MGADEGVTVDLLKGTAGDGWLGTDVAGDGGGECFVSFLRPFRLARSWKSEAKERRGIRRIRCVAGIVQKCVPDVILTQDARTGWDGSRRFFKLMRFEAARSNRYCTPLLYMYTVPARVTWYSTSTVLLYVLYCSYRLPLQSAGTAGASRKALQLMSCCPSLETLPEQVQYASFTILA